jgi:hypothetical protein
MYYCIRHGKLTMVVLRKHSIFTFRYPALAESLVSWLIPILEGICLPRSHSRGGVTHSPLGA